MEIMETREWFAAHVVPWNAILVFASVSLMFCFCIAEGSRPFLEILKFWELST
jgi:hypothetical protein